MAIVIEGLNLEEKLAAARDAALNDPSYRGPLDDLVKEVKVKEKKSEKPKSGTRVVVRT